MALPTREITTAPGYRASANQEWADYLSDYLGVAMPPQKAARWRRWIDAEITPPPSDATIMAALKHAVHSKDAAEAGTVKVGQVIWWVRSWLRSDSQSQYARPETDAEVLTAIQRACSARGMDHFQRWEIICGPAYYGVTRRDTTESECAQLEFWARTTFGDWKRPTHDEIAARSVRHSVRFGADGTPRLVPESAGVRV